MTLAPLLQDRLLPRPRRLKRVPGRLSLRDVWYICTANDSDPLLDGAARLLAEIAGMVEGLADQTNGGYGTQFKFLHTEANEFSLYLHEATGEANYLDHVVFTLDKMGRSATFDGKDGGFFRYSSQPDWSEPHPEKYFVSHAPSP